MDAMASEVSLGILIRCFPMGDRQAQLFVLEEGSKPTDMLAARASCSSSACCGDWSAPITPGPVVANQVRYYLAPARPGAHYLGHNPFSMILAAALSLVGTVVTGAHHLGCLLGRGC